MPDSFATLGGPLILCSLDVMDSWPGSEDPLHNEAVDACVDWITPIQIHGKDFYILKGPDNTVKCYWQPNPITKGGLLWRSLKAPESFEIPSKIDIYVEARQVLETLYNRSEKQHYAVFDSMFTGEEARFAESFIEMNFPIYFVSLDTYEFKKGRDVHFAIHNFRPIGPAQRESTLIPSSRPRIMR